MNWPFFLALAWCLWVWMALAIDHWGIKAPRLWQWHRRLRRETGEVYMDRWQLLRTRRLSIYINRINLPDADPLPHTHPWVASWSFKLKGFYIEEVYTWNTSFDDEPMVVVRIPARLNRIPEVHRIAAVTPGGCWTLFIGWRAVRPWGFVEADGGIIPSNVRKADRGVTSEE